MTTGQQEFTDPDGVMYVTFNSGSGSKNYRITSEAFPYTDVQYQNNGRSYSHLSVDGDSLTVTTYDLENGSVTDTFTIHKTVEATGITLDQSEVSLNEGETAQLSATVQPEDTTDATVTWTSSNTAVATVDENGLVTALTAGEATITAATSNGLTATCTVTVTAKEAPADPDQPGTDLPGTTDPGQPGSGTGTNTGNNTNTNPGANTGTNTGADTNTNTETSAVPQTGDQADLTLWALLAMAAAAAVAIPAARKVLVKGNR